MNTPQEAGFGGAHLPNDDEDEDGEGGAHGGGKRWVILEAMALVTGDRGA